MQAAAGVVRLTKVRGKVMGVVKPPRRRLFLSWRNFTYHAEADRVRRNVDTRSGSKENFNEG